MHYLNSGKLTFSVGEKADTVVWTAAGTPLMQSLNADFWRAYLDDGYEKEMTVRSSKQNGTVSQEGNTLIIRYDTLITDTGRSFPIGLTVTVKACCSTYPGFLFGATVENRSEARCNELMLPFIDLQCGCDEKRENDVFYHMNGLGERIENPWEQIKLRSHSEYMSSDQHQIWYPLRYPGDASMGWFGLQSGGHFLYMGRQDTKMKVCVLSVGTSPRYEDPRLMMTISHLPFVKSGEKVSITECFVSLNEGDWQTGSDIYGNYARDNWYTPPTVPDWVKQITGWQRIILRHQFGEIQYRYEDLPRIYEEGRKYGLNMLMVFGWWKGRFDNGYPIYEPDDALGGVEKLKEAIQTVQSMGGRVALYTNGQLIDVNTDFYRDVGYRICRIDIDGNEYRDHYKFGNDGTALRCFGYKSFVTACAATNEWQERIVMHEKMKFDFGADTAFFDQIGAASPLPCFNENHLHGARPDEVENWRVEAFKNLRKNCPPGKAIGTEMVNDMSLSYIDYIHGCQLGPIFRDGCFPELFMRTFPQVIQTDRFVHDNKAGTDRQLAHAFIHGFRHDVCPYRGRVHIGEIPALAQKLKEILALKAQYSRFFYDGVYSYDPISLPEGVRSGCFTHEKERIYALWNDTDTVQQFMLAGKEIEMKPQEVTVCLA